MRRLLPLQQRGLQGGGCWPTARCRPAGRARPQSSSGQLAAHPLRAGREGQQEQQRRERPPPLRREKDSLLLALPATPLQSQRQKQCWQASE